MTVFGQFRTKFGFDFVLEIDIFGFCGVFWYHNNSVMNRGGTNRCPILYGSEIWAILCVIA